MFDEEYLKPFFIFNYKERKGEIQEFKKLLKMNSPEFKGGQYVALMKASLKQTIVEQNEAKPKKSMFTDGLD